VNGVKEMLALKQRHAINKNDLVICLFSGGGSALMTCVVDEINLEDVRITTELLLSSGAEIAEINAVRKHLSKIKGGRLGNFYSPATVISLVLSDVIGDDLSVIASGSTFPDFSTFSDACNVLKKYDLLDRLPGGIIDYLEKGCRGEAAETPKALTNFYCYCGAER
jgi:glycerate-2-kinase